MKINNLFVKFFFCTFFLLTSCTEDGDTTSGSSLDSSSDSFSQGALEDTTAGQVTAAEWNDLDNWLFWIDILNDNAYHPNQAYWDFYTLNRLAFKVNDASNLPVNTALVSLYKDNILVAEAMTDNFGVANLFLNLHEDVLETIDFQNYSLKINDIEIAQDIIPFNEGVNEISITNVNTVADKIEISFIVDATASMSDELEFLKNDLQDVISRVQDENQSTSVLTSTVFYRDYGDEYLAIESDFTSDTNTTLNFIEQQYADGGGDFPEAVDVAINKSISELQWSENAKTKIAFLLLDAPPHHEIQITASIHESIKLAARKGIKIIPITASGIDKQTEFLMRFIAIASNGTYVFITNDSGIGNNHLEPTVGEYQVEFLNDLMVRLINKYSE